MMRSIQQIIDSINPSSNDILVEIGPGMGRQPSNSKTKAKLHGIELDQDLYSYLSKTTEIFKYQFISQRCFSFKLSG